MDRLQAINEVLRSINEMPLSNDDVVEEIPVAVLVDGELDFAKREVLSKGYNFNRVIYDLSPDADGYINIPESYLSVDPTDDASDYILRDRKLFNKTDKTFIFDAPVECVVLENIYDFDDIEYTVANYIVKLASLNCYMNIIGDANGVQLRARLVNDARIEAMKTNARNIDGNILGAEFVTTLLDRDSF